MKMHIQMRIDSAYEEQRRITHAVNEARFLGSLVDLIKHVAGQTNLLSLNVASEAVSKIRDGIREVANSIEKEFGMSKEAIKLQAVREMLPLQSMPQAIVAATRG